jgi:O-antigen/teichoic acid export membrane protein
LHTPTTNQVNLTTNLLANFAGSIWAALAQLVVVPIYVRLIGVEGYALVGFYTLMLTLSQVLDLGVSPTVNRQLARYSVAKASAQEARDLVRTLEVGYWLTGVGIGLGISMAASWVAGSWFQSSTIPTARVRDVIAMMGALVALQWPLTFYYGGLGGLQRQVPLNALKVGFGFFASIGGVMVIALVSRNVEALFLWLVAAAAMHIIVVTIVFWKQMPDSAVSARFRPRLIRPIWRFAAGMSVITLASILLTQLDKVILSRVLALESFGYYVLAGVLASSLYVIIAPVFSAVLPRMSALVAAGDEISLARLYHFAAQLITALVAPVAAVLMLFPFDVLKLWLGSGETAQRSAVIASLLVGGTAVNALANIPYALQLAYGWTRLGAYLGALMLVLFVPTLIALSLNYAGVGAALAWALLNLASISLAVPLTHQRYLRNELRRWLVSDVALPVLAAFGVVIVARLLIREPLEGGIAIYTLAPLLVGSWLAAVVASSELRGAIASLRRNR